MKKIKLTAIEDEFEDGKGLHFEFDLTPYVITCAMACGILFVVRFIEKHFFKE